MKEKKKPEYAGTCDTCGNCIYDEDYDDYVCEAYMDEDDVARLWSGEIKACPFYQSDDEYKIVRHQM